MTLLWLQQSKNKKERFNIKDHNITKKSNHFFTDCTFSPCRNISTPPHHQHLVLLFFLWHFNVFCSSFALFCADVTSFHFLSLHPPDRAAGRVLSRLRGRRHSAVSVSAPGRQLAGQRGKHGPHHRGASR